MTSDTCANDSTPSPDEQGAAPQHIGLDRPYGQVLPMLALLIATIALASQALGKPAQVAPLIADAVPLSSASAQPIRTLPGKRQSTDVCKRWAGQSALVNGTLYYQGGRFTTSASQNSNEWTNQFISLDLTKSWQISSPSENVLPAPSNLPAVSSGVLWQDYDNLYLYGGEFSDNPVVLPTSVSVWEYSIAKSSWSELTNPQFQGGQAVQRAAEGAGISIPSIGESYYFGGHLDGYTTPGWSQSVARVYLGSMLEFTAPGYNNAVLGTTAGSGGLYRNITVASAGFPERADGVLVYVPGYSSEGIIVGLAGGNNQSFDQLNLIDVYDIASSTWYKQATSGPTPQTRVNPCAVAASAADGSSTQIYMYGGQNLLPYDAQTQLSDVWILTVPSFTWIEVNTTGQSVPPARAGHTCNIWNGQMVSVGGYAGQDLSCDSPGIYVFNASSLQWQNQYLALASDGDNLNRQKAQRNDSNALQGSYGYQVPDAVQKVVGGNSVGSATVTQPAQTPAQGPLVSGRPQTYTITGSGGAVVTQTSAPNSSNSNSNSSKSSSGTNVGAIVAGVIAGLLFLLVIYLGFCAWLYRKQLVLYKNHDVLSRHSDLAGSTPRGGKFAAVPFLGAAVAGKTSSHARSSSEKAMTAGRSSNESRSHRQTMSGGSRDGETGFHVERKNKLNSNNPYNQVPGGAGFATAASSTEDLMNGQEPSFLGVVLNPRRSLRVVNRD